MENLYTKDCIRTFTGKYFNVFEPDPSLIDIEDIAHSLSFQCRFGGRLPVFYTVAQHSVLTCSSITEYRKEALLHDAAEAYLLDIPAPIKNRLPDYKAVEENLIKCIFNKFGLEYPLPLPVKLQDRAMLELEWNEIMLKRTANGFNQAYSIIDVWEPALAKQNFLSHFDMLFYP